MASLLKRVLTAALTLAKCASEITHDHRSIIRFQTDLPGAAPTSVAFAAAQSRREVAMAELGSVLTLDAVVERPGLPGQRTWRRAPMEASVDSSTAATDWDRPKPLMSAWVESGH